MLPVAGDWPWEVDLVLSCVCFHVFHATSALLHANCCCTISSWVNLLACCCCCFVLCFVFCAFPFQHANCMLQTINLVLTILFTVELVIKHIALGLLGYWSDPYNDLDGVIVLASLVDLGLQYSGVSHSHGGGGVSSLRILRLLRVLRSLKLLRQVEGLNKIMNIVLKVYKHSVSCSVAGTMFFSRPDHKVNSMYCQVWHAAVLLQFLIRHAELCCYGASLMDLGRIRPILCCSVATLLCCSR